MIVFLVDFKYFFGSILVQNKLRKKGKNERV